MGMRLHWRTPTPSGPPTRASVTQSTPASPESVSQEAESPYDEIRYTAAGEEWRFVVTWMPDVEYAQNELSVYRSGHLVRRLRAEQLGGLGLEVKRIRLRSGNSIVGVFSYPGAGHATAKHFFTVRDHHLVYMGQVGGENGGPVLQDEDGDGRPEWVFDNYRWYEHYTDGPTQYLIFKETKEGKLWLWKRLPNRKRRQLPDRFGFECC